MLTRAVKGVRDVVNIIGHAAKLASPIQYTLEVRDSKQTIIFWSGNVGGFTLEAATILVEGDDALIREIRVLMRPWPVVTIFRNAMYVALSWTITPRGCPFSSSSPIRAKEVPAGDGRLYEVKLDGYRVEGTRWDRA